MFVSGDPLIPADKRRMLDEENIAMTMAYNFMSAFVACLVIILLGESCKSSKDHSKPRNEVDTSLKSPV